jgi:hypothetical protein
VTGDVDYELLIACRAIADLDSVLTCLRGCGGTEMASAELVLHEVAGPEAARPAPALAGATARPGRPVRPRPACVSTETWTRESGR